MNIAAMRPLRTRNPATMSVAVIGPMVAGWYGITRASTSEDYASAARRHPAFGLADTATEGDERGA